MRHSQIITTYQRTDTANDLARRMWHTRCPSRSAVEHILHWQVPMPLAWHEESAPCTICQAVHFDASPQHADTAQGFLRHLLKFNFYFFI
jgi:hypothetical protein